MKIFLVRTILGNRVESSKDLATVTRRMKREFGTRGFISAKVATDAELLEHKRLGGWLPVSVRARIERLDSTAAKRNKVDDDIYW